jgi:hypothetical protein
VIWTRGGGERARVVSLVVERDRIRTTRGEGANDRTTGRPDEMASAGDLLARADALMKKYAG